MVNTIYNKFAFFSKNKDKSNTEKFNIANAELNITYTIKKIDTTDEEIKKFLFTLGCYEGESITLISKVSSTYIVSIKDGRYSIDKELAKTILI